MADAIFISAGLFASLLLTVACMPLELALVIDRPASRVVWSASMRAVYGLLKMSFRSDQSKPKETKAPVKKEESANLARFRPLLRTGIVQRGVSLLRRLLSRLHFIRGSLEGVVGLEQPSDTGMLWGALFPVLSLLASRPGMHVDVRPEFQEPVVQGTLDVQLRVRPVLLVWESLRALLDPFVLKTLWAMRR